MSWEGILRKDSNKNKLLNAIKWLVRQDFPNEIKVNWNESNFNVISEDEAKDFIDQISDGKIAYFYPEAFFIGLELDRKPFDILNIELNNVWTYGEKYMEKLEHIVNEFKRRVE